MNIASVELTYFSPTGTTRTTLEGIARGFAVEQVRHLDLTPPRQEINRYGLAGLDPQPSAPACEFHRDLAVMGAPAYGGRIPATATKRFRTLRAHGEPAVAVVVYGNRHYDDALLELRDLAHEQGFTPVAGAAFIGEHTADYALPSDAPGIARGRPDGAIIVTGEVNTDKTTRIMCLACVKYCPTGARTARDTWMKRAGDALSKWCSKRLEPEVCL